MTPNITTPRDFFDSLRRGPYTSIGCYPVYWVCEDGGALSYEACMENAAQIGRAIRDSRKGCPDDKQWRVIHHEINWEDPDLTCDHTGKRIESAYAEDDAPDDAPDEADDNAPEPCTETPSRLSLANLGGM